MFSIKLELFKDYMQFPNIISDHFMVSTLDEIIISNAVIFVSDHCLAL